MIAQHAMICIYNFIMVYAFGTTLGKLCTGSLVVLIAVSVSMAVSIDIVVFANAFMRFACCKATAQF